VAVYLGLKPQAESYHPFGIRPTVLIENNRLTAVHKIDSTSPVVATIEDEDDYERPLPACETLLISS